MLQKLGDHIASCLERAADADRRAAEASNEALRADNKRLAQSWRHLARSYQFFASLERFLFKPETTRSSDQPSETEVSKVPAPGAAFDPDTITVLTAGYSAAVEGQPASVHEIIAKLIIDLASEGERDPDKLRQVAYSVLTRSPAW